ncbi:substrate-binding periplasmic protein [Malikia spinosa]|uniref:substrate-binding periplasmic protein n=1 Tax=Malikia spinosa TaxID=86180 RepID=UPI0027B97A9E|nr:transporter substrate-binding domain-containing protein [Malikia spinosa]
MSDLHSHSRRRLLQAGALALALPAMALRAQELEDLDKVRAAGTLKVALYKDNGPYSDGKGEAFSGVDVALARGLAREMGLGLQLLAFDAGENMNDDLRNMVWRGHYLGYGPADVMLHVPADKFLMRQNPQVLLFGPYARETLVVFHDRQRLPEVRSGDDLASLALGAERGSGAASTLMGYRNGRLRDQVRIFNSGVQAADAVLQGEVAAAYVTRAQAETALFRRQADAARFGLSQLGLPGLSDNGWPLGMAVKSSHRALATELEAALQRLRDKGELLAMFRSQGLTLMAP